MTSEECPIEQQTSIETAAVSSKEELAALETQLKDMYREFYGFIGDRALKSQLGEARYPILNGMSQAIAAKHGERARLRFKAFSQPVVEPDD
jgi:hypothetical protein